MLSLKDLRTAFDALISGSAGHEQRSLLREAIESGQATIATGERAVAVGGSADDAMIVTGDDAEVEVEKGLINLAHSGAALTDVGQLFHPTDDNTLADGAGANIKGWLCVGVDVGLGTLLLDTETSVV